MIVSKEDIWKRQDAIGILEIPAIKGNYLQEPEFVPRHLLEDCFGEPGLKGVIVRGSGRHFSAGADLQNLREMAKDEALLFRSMCAGKELLRMIDELPLPVVAEINGVCFGGGLEIALACHIRICSATALFAFPEANHGIMPGLGGTISLSKLIGPGKAAEMILSGDIVSCDKAREIGLADHLAPVKDLREFTLKFLEKLTSDREITVIRSIMQSIRNSRVMDEEKALEEETRFFCALAAGNREEI
jgi:enoyl-CoA hydratase/carnithine racemase